MRKHILLAVLFGCSIALVLAITDAIGLTITGNEFWNKLIIAIAWGALWGITEGFINRRLQKGKGML